MTKERRPFIRLTVALSLSGVLLLLLAGASNSVSTAKADGITVREGSLAPTGIAYEINPDTHGNLWITDYGANQIWQVQPATGAVTVYSGLANPSDARPDAAGMVWLTNAGNTDLERISPGTSTVTAWKLPGTGALGGVAFDGAGRVWTTDVLFNGMIYRFTPGTGEVCTYTIPDGGAGAYILAKGADIWLGDTANNRLLKLDSGSAVFTLWQLEGGAIPKGIALEADGNLWWADESQPRLGRLEPGISRMTAYTLPVGTPPEMVALNQGKVWYAQTNSGMVGELDPAKASGISSTLVKTTTPVTPGCSNLGAGTNSTVVTSTATLAWTDNVYQRIVASDGWTVYQLPTNGHPWGIVAGQNAVWIVDQGRQRLAWLSQATYVHLPLIIR